MKILLCLFFCLGWAAVGETATLNWLNGSSTYANVYVERATSSTGTFARVATIAGTLQTYIDSAGAVGNCWRVQGHFAASDTGYSNIACLVAPPAPPTETVTASCVQVIVTTPSPTPGLVAGYAFSEGTGTTTADASGNNRTGTLTNGATWAAGKYGTAVSFDGTNDKVTLPSTVDLASLPFTLEAWIRPTSFADWRAIFSKRASPSASQMRFDVGLSITTGRVYVFTSNSTVTSTYAPPLNAWTHLAVVADSSGTKLYVNGALQQTLGAITLGSSSTALVNIGGTGDNQDPFAGQIDNLRLWNRALSAAEIQADMTH